MEISLQRYVKKLLMARCQPLRPQRKKAGMRERAALFGLAQQLLHRQQYPQPAGLKGQAALERAAFRAGCLEKRHKKSAVARAFFVLSCKGIR